MKDKNHETKKEILQSFGVVYNSEGEYYCLTDEIPKFVTFINDINRGEKCLLCHSTNNPVWYTSNETWNKIVGEDGCLCLYCFINKAHDVNKIIRWKIEPEFINNTNENPELL